MQKRIPALLLALALGGSLLATAAFAEEHTETAIPAEETQESGETLAEETLPPLTETSGAQQSVLASAADGVTVGAENPGLTVPQPDEVGQLSYANLETRVRENNLSVLALQETIESVKVTDYNKLRGELEDQLDGLEDMTDGIKALMQGLGTVTTPPDGTPSLVLDANDRLTQLLAGYVLETLESSTDSLEDAITDIRSGKTQKKAEDGIRQMENGQDQYVIGTQSLYITVLELQNTRAGLERTLEAMDRTVQEMELRYSMGQISALQLRQVKDGRVQIQSGLDTLNNSIEGAVIQLEMMVGADITGKMTVTEVPAVTDAQVDAINYAADLDQVRQKSYDIYAAKATLDEAEEAYKDAKKGYGKSSYQWKAAEHKWQAAQYTYQAAVQAFEAKFRACCSAVTDYRQILRAKESALALQKDTYRAMELKYRRGMISKNDYLAAKDDLAEAQDAVTTAQHNLFTAYSAYDWAVRFGVLN